MAIVAAVSDRVRLGTHFAQPTEDAVFVDDGRLLVAGAIDGRTRVRLLDISASGALVETDLPLPIGAKGQLRFALAGSAYAPTVQIRRRAGSQTRELNLGAVFTSMDDTSRRRLEDFLRKATP